jgi:hypothetical protein
MYSVVEPIAILQDQGHSYVPWLLGSCSEWASLKEVPRSDPASFACSRSNSPLSRTRSTSACRHSPSSLTRPPSQLSPVQATQPDTMKYIEAVPQYTL